MTSKYIDWAEFRHRINNVKQIGEDEQFNSWVIENVFPTYLMKHSRKKTTLCTCSHCQATFDVTSKKSGEAELCPNCGKIGNYHCITEGKFKYGSWDKIVIPYMQNGEIWLHFVRMFQEVTFKNGQVSIKHDLIPYDLGLTVIEPNNRRTVYLYCSMACQMADWHILHDKTNANFDSAVVCPLWLDELPDNYHGINLHEFANQEVAIDLKMWKAEQSDNVIRGERTYKGLIQSLGIDSDMAKLYKKYRITDVEHQFIASAKKFNDRPKAEEIAKLKKLRLGNYARTEILEHMSFAKFVNYFTKLENTTHMPTFDLIGTYKDYLRMAKEYGISLKDKSIRYPADLLEAHNEVMALHIEKLKEQKALADAERLARVLATERATATTLCEFNGFTMNGFVAVVPTKYSQLVEEGINQHICVGSGTHYFEGHLNGSRPIVFIRKENHESKSFFCMELNADRNYGIVQLRGFGNCSANDDVEAFANELVQAINKKSNNKKECA